jgi:hypothetical protein
MVHSISAVWLHVYALYLAAAAPLTALRLFLLVGLGLLARLAFLASLAASSSLVVGFVYTAVVHSTVVHKTDEQYRHSVSAKITHGRAVLARSHVT